MIPVVTPRPPPVVPLAQGPLAGRRRWVPCPLQPPPPPPLVVSLAPSGTDEGGPRGCDARVSKRPDPAGRGGAPRRG